MADPTRPSFALELFQGTLRPELLLPYPVQDPEDEAAGDAFLAELEALFEDKVDADEIDATGEIPDEVIEALKSIGAFGIKIPTDHGGRGLSQTNYTRALGLMASHCANTTVLLGAHNSIGVPQPVALFGSEEQKAKYFPMLAGGAISGFALTEADAGSDPANMATTAELSEDGTHWVLDGEKLWCTNGVIADLFIVIARTPDKEIKGKVRRQYTAFIVENAWEGVDRSHRCHFLGLKALYAGVLKLDKVKVPVENVLFEEGRGLKVALTTLNAGRLTLPSATIGAAKWCLREARLFANERVVWGNPIGQHEAIASKIGYIAATAFAMESMTRYTAAMVDRKDVDIRVEAAMCKMFASESLWSIVDETLQIRSGRGFETKASLEARGERGVPIERLLRDARINMIFEGTSEIMRLFLAREALGPHMARMKTLSRAPAGERAKEALHYATWYPRTWTPTLGGYGVHKRLEPHLAWAAGASKRLSRTLVHAMVRHGTDLAKRQSFLGRCVEIGADLFAVCTSVARAQSLLQGEGPEGASALELADAFAALARARVEATFRAMGDNADREAYALAQGVLAGEHEWLESATAGRSS